MLRLIVLYLCVLSFQYADLSSDNFLYSGLMPLVNICFLVYILMTPYMFLYRKGLMGRYSRLEQDNKGPYLAAAFMRELRHKYDGKFILLGGFSSLAEGAAFIVEIVLVIYAMVSMYQMLITELVN